MFAHSRIPVTRRHRKAGLHRRKAALDLDSKVSRFSTSDLPIPTYASGRFQDLWMVWYVSPLTLSAPLVNGSFINRFIVSLPIVVTSFVLCLYPLWWAWVDRDE